MVEIVCAFVAALATIISAYIASMSKRQNDKAEQRGELRRRESLLNLRMSEATLSLAVVCSNALTGGHNNGNVEEARIQATKAANEYKAFIEEIAAKEMAK